MANYNAQVILTTTDNVAENYITNLWHFSANGPGDLGNITTQLVAFYNTCRPHLSPLLNQNGHRIKYYDMADPKPRNPVAEVTWNLGAALTGTTMPPEVSLCLSYQAARISGEAQARRRGRVYIGPLNINSIAPSGRPTSTVLAAWDTAGTALLAASVAASVWKWKQASTVSLGFADVANGWVDDEFDTQRRRGRKSTSRLVFP